MTAAFDAKKNSENIAKHGISLAAFVDFDFEYAIHTTDNRMDYKEVRYVSYGWLNKRLHCLVWTLREGAIRPISLRKANKRERKFYEKQI
jgi:uncharacterized DUF497 family protein